MSRRPPKPRTHAGATYRVINFDGVMFGVEITIPEMLPASVGKFATRADAQTWIRKHRSRVKAESESGRWFGAVPSFRQDRIAECVPAAMSAVTNTPRSGSTKRVQRVRLKLA
jgi:hypothetical protein